VESVGCRGDRDVAFIEVLSPRIEWQANHTPRDFEFRNSEQAGFKFRSAAASSSSTSTFDTPILRRIYSPWFRASSSCDDRRYSSPTAVHTYAAVASSAHELLLYYSHLLAGIGSRDAIFDIL
jgi:hypothetical protein